MSDSFILHLATHTAWLAALEQGAYCPDSLRDEGFIHCSTLAQIVNVANNFYLDQRGLVLLIIDPARLTSELKWEPPFHPHSGQETVSSAGLFPHIYGSLNLNAVRKAIPFEPGEDGHFYLPPGLES